MSIRLHGGAQCRTLPRRMAKIAIIETGGKQYLVTNDSVVTVEKLPVPKGGKVTFDKVLLVDDGKETKVGAPYVSGAKVSGELLEEGCGCLQRNIEERPEQHSRFFKSRRTLLSPGHV